MAISACRWVHRLMVALGVGLLVALSLPPFGFWPLGLVGFGAFASMLPRERAMSRAAAGLAFGVGQFAVGLAFIDQFTGLGYALAVPVEAAFFAVAAALVPSCVDPSRWPFALSFSGACTLAEWARERIPFGGLPLGSSALGQVDGPLAPLARLGGPLLVTALAALLGAAAVVALRRSGRGAAAVMVLGAGALVTVAAYAPAGGPVTRVEMVAAVQGGGPRGTSEIEVPNIDAFAATLAQSAAVSGHAMLVVWPEDTVPLSDGTSLVGPLGIVAALARSLRSTFVVGATEPVMRTRFLNEAIALSPEGRVVATVEKSHPVPFGEYVPMRAELDHFVDLAAVPLDATVGRGDGAMATPSGRLALLISYEAFFADRARSGVRGGGQLLVVPTNTSSYSSDQVPAQELAGARLDAIATGRSLVQAATIGYTAFVDPDGTVTAKLGLGHAGVLERQVALHAGRTVFDDVGDMPVILAAVLVCCGPLLLAARRRRRRQPDRARTERDGPLSGP